ncbi:hypothetical protein GGI04_005432 [Coemansia thaxteri]|nr:hypothetical protein GGI04_005432 [Coemansia thaxteri]
MALHEARVANENLGPALQPRRLSEPPLLLFVEDDSRHHSPSSAALPVSSAVGHSSVASRPAGTFVPLLRSGPPGSQALRQATLQPAALATSAQPSAAILKSAEQDEVVTVVSELVSTVHVQRGPFVPAATPAPGPGVPILGPAPVPARAPVWAPVPDSGPKTLDSAGSAASTTYMMQVAGNLTSGGPIGVNIEFTEPLHLLWRDMVVGVIRFPESIHVPGRGTTQWRWPPFEVAIPANGTRLVADDRVLRGPPSDEQIHPGSNQVNGIAQRRVMGASGSAALGRSGQEPDDLASWFAAIQAHRPFTMHWRSRVKVSAMGMHASNIKFEKSVRVLCDETQGCSIDNSPFTV